MHGLLVLAFAISIELFVLLCSLNFLAKIKRDSLGGFFKLMTYFIITVATLVLLCTIICGSCRMCCHKGMGGCKEMEIEKCYGEGMGGHHMMMRMHGGDCDDMPCCKEMKGCKEMEGKEDCPFDKNGKCMGDEKKCCMDKDGKGAMMEKDTIVKHSDTKAKK